MGPFSSQATIYSTEKRAASEKAYPLLPSGRRSNALQAYHAQPRNAVGVLPPRLQSDGDYFSIVSKTSLGHLGAEWNEHVRWVSAYSVAESSRKPKPNHNVGKLKK